MKKWILRAAFVFLALTWGQWQFIRGFNFGADTDHCVMAFILHDPDHTACQRVPINDPAMRALRGYRRLSGDEVKIQDGVGQ